jgi:hypothetical protein
MSSWQEGTRANTPLAGKAAVAGSAGHEKGQLRIFPDLTFFV